MQSKNLELLQSGGGYHGPASRHWCLFADTDEGPNSLQGFHEPEVTRYVGEGENMVRISARQQGQTTILDVSGDIDFANSTEVRQWVLNEIRDSHTPRLLVNLSQVRYVDSSGVASLVEGLKASRDLGSRLILFGPNPSVREVLELSHLNKVFEVYDNEEQALAA